MSVLPTHLSHHSHTSPFTHLQQTHDHLLFFPTTTPHWVPSLQQSQSSHNIIFPTTQPRTSSSHHHPISQYLPRLLDTTASLAHTNSISEAPYQILLPSTPSATYAPTPNNPTNTSLLPHTHNHSYIPSKFHLSPSTQVHFPPLLHHMIAPLPPLTNPVVVHIPHHIKETQPQTTKPPNFRQKYTIRDLKTILQARNPPSSSSVRCLLCPELFQNRVNAERHRRGSHPTTPHSFQCTYCTASYESKGARTIHVNKAHREIPSTLTLQIVKKSRAAIRKRANVFQCLHNNCRKIYSNLSNLNRHFKMDHIKKRYPCPNCDYSATTRWNLKVHKNKIHQQN